MVQKRDKSDLKVTRKRKGQRGERKKKGEKPRVKKKRGGAGKRGKLYLPRGEGVRGGLPNKTMRGKLNNS